MRPKYIAIITIIAIAATVRITTYVHLLTNNSQPTGNLMDPRAPSFKPIPHYSLIRK